MFFDTLKYLKENKPDSSDEALSFLAVKSTVKNYFGGFGGNREERMKLTEANEYANDGHAFCIVEIGGVQKLFDATMQIYRAFHDFNPVEKMLNGEPFEITKEDQKYTYANASTSIKHNR